MKRTVNERKRTLIFINLILTCVASSMLMTALVSALPAVSQDLGVPFSTGQWLTSGYSLVMGVMMPLTAFLITRFRTKRLYLAGLGISLAGLLLCAFAPNFAVVMFARCLQAVGNGITASMAQVIILTIYPPEKRGAAMGWYGLSTGAAPAIAPILAGVILDTIGWRAIFGFVFAILLAAFVWAVFSFADVLEIEQKSFDVHSFVLSVMAFGCVTLGIGNLGGKGVADARVWIVFAVGIFAAVFFVARQLRLEKPFLDVRVFQNRNFTVSVFSGVLFYLEMMGLTALLPLYIQTVCGYSATVSGAVKLPGSLIMAATSLLAGTLIDKIGMRKIFLTGTLLMLFGNVGMSMLHPQSALWQITVLNAIHNMAIGCLLTPLVTWGLQGLPKQLTAHGSALMTSLRTVSGSVGTAIFVSVISSDSAQGASASAQGFRTACGMMALITAALLVVGILFVPKGAGEAAAKCEERKGSMG